jgi:5-methylcytosine-specific restriction endonuclease McrA
MEKKEFAKPKRKKRHRNSRFLHKNKNEFSQKVREKNSFYREQKEKELEKARKKSEARKVRKKILRIHNHLVPQHQIITKDNWQLIREHWDCKCAYCKANESTTIDHAKPISKNGTNALDNVIPACVECNKKKGSLSMLEWMGAEPIYAMHENGFIFISDFACEEVSAAEK